MHFRICVILCVILAHARTEPQLDLPPINALNAPPTDRRYNNYVSTNNPLALQGDVDRSQRYGPPYREDKAANDGVDDYRLGQTYMYDERNRYGSNYPLTGAHNLTRDSPFSDRGNDGARFRNHNYENPREVAFQDRYADRYNGRTQQQQPQGRQYEDTNDLNPYGNNQQNLNVPNYPSSTAYPNNRYDEQNYGNRYEQNYPSPNPISSTTPFPGGLNNPQNYPNPNSSPTPFPRGLNNPQNYPNPNANPNPYGVPQNPYVSPFPQNFRNEDRFNLNQRENERERFRQDRRFQIELERLRNFLVETDHKGSQECTANVAAQWNYETNVNDFTQAEAVNIN